VEKTTEEFARRKAKSALEKRSQHHDFIGVGSRDVFPLSQPPLEHSPIGEKMVFYKFEEFAQVHERRFEHFRVGGSHGKRSKG
jgi:hypothetical protein